MSSEFFFLQNDRLNAPNKNVSANKMVDNFTRTIVETVDHFAPENHIQTQWITNKLKNSQQRRDNLFQNWITNPNLDNHKRFRQFRNKVTKWIRERKKEDNFRKFAKKSHC